MSENITEYLTFLKSKLHNACVTHTDLEYEGSCAIDSNLLTAAGIRPYQQIHIYNKFNGERFTTYAIPAKADSRIICVNGAAAHKAKPGDRIIICTYVEVSSKELDEKSQSGRWCETGYEEYCKEITIIHLDLYNRPVNKPEEKSWYDKEV